MNGPERPVLTDDDVDATLRSWMQPGPQSLDDRTLTRVIASVRATRQAPAWRRDARLERGLRALRYLGAAAVVVLAAAVLAWGARGPGHPAVAGGQPSESGASPVAASPSPAARLAPTVTGVTLDGAVSATGATYRVRYPQIAGQLDPSAALAINTWLAGQAQAAVQGFVSGIGKDPQAGPDQPSMLQVDYSVAYASPDLLSLRVNAYSYPSGAAHGGDLLTTSTFDLATGKRLALADLFRPGVDYLGVIATEARTQLRASLADWMTNSFTTQWLDTGTQPTAGNYAAWVITAGGLEVTFEQYQVAAYAAGMPVVTIPFAHLAGLIDPAGIVAALADSHLPSVTVTLGIYSGLPDPSWPLTDVQVAALVGQLASLPVASGPTPQGGLGYHGFTMRLQQPGQADQVYVAFRGTVTGTGDAPGSYRADPQRGVESALLATGRSRLSAAQVAAVEADLALP